MNGLPPTLNKVIESFSRFPGIGKKTAHRLGLHVLKSHSNEIEEFAQALLDVKSKINTCNNCYNISETNLCEICLDENRAKSIICICEEPSDIYLIEKTGFKGVYHVLGGLLSPLDGIGPDDIGLDQFETLLGNKDLKEVILLLQQSHGYHKLAKMFSQHLFCFRKYLIHNFLKQ